MKDQLIQLEAVAKQARQAVHRGWTEKAEGYIAELRTLLDAIDPPARCSQCGAKPNPRLNELDARKFKERTQA
jgi:hypothetical protein